jgi:hypothetical protein
MIPDWKIFTQIAKKCPLGEKKSLKTLPILKKLSWLLK